MTYVILAVFALLVSPYVLPIMSRETFLEYSDSWVDLPLILLSTILCLAGRLRARSSRERTFWVAWGVGFGIWFIGRVIWALLFDLGVAIDLAADFVYQLLYVGLLVAIETDPAARPPTAFRQKLRRYTISGGVVLLMTGYLYFALIPGLASPETYESWKPSVVGSLVFDLYVAIRLFVRWRRCPSEHWRRVYGWLTLGFLWWVATDALDVFWIYTWTPHLNGGTLLDLVWYVPYVLVAFGALEGRRDHQENVRARPTSEPLVAAGPLGGILLVGYAFTFLMLHIGLQLGGLINPELGQLRNALLAGETLIMAGLVVASYRLILKENRRLRTRHKRLARSLEEANRELGNRVEERTADLARANSRNKALIKAIPDTLVLLDRDLRVVEVFAPGGGTLPLA